VILGVSSEEQLRHDLQGAAAAIPDSVLDAVASELTAGALR
jgi:hypothetical protein